ncbi:unnamed protein product [Ostreobium quekettii]|uniref:Pentatricopeptide repeat-containing protein n=1 Tax=Ostreobium quekettii TaxID=121088 RepID=A0A8S1ITY7_9CHLO|nr:unnamed protein product [Ostreobium quekettii]|eukprot:evm.model.scf_665.2 EVM.evm.TU.scf_665.2   scf_665:17715-22275(-)
MLGAHARQANVEGGSAVYGSICRSGVRPDIFTYLAMFNMIASHGKEVSQATGQQARQGALGWQDANRSRIKLWQSDYSKLWHWEKDMRQRFKLQHDTLTLKALMRAYSRVGKVDDVVRVLHEEVNAGRLKVQADAYAIAIGAAARWQKMDAALKLHEQMVKRGVPATVQTYNSLMVGLKHKSATKHTNTMRLLRQMQADGLRPDAVTYHVLVSIACSSGDVGDGLRWVEEMMRRRIRPVPETWANLVAACVDGRHSLELEKVVGMMDERQEELMRSVLDEL